LFEHAYAAVEAMLVNWNNTNYMDLVLLHFPECGGWIPDCNDKTGGDWMGAYMALEELLEEGKIRAIGVSNFDLVQLEELVDMTDNVHVIQHWMDPFEQNLELLEWAQDHDIVVTAYR
jgi:diketogulonate reductase-like aldo/keto reductase